MDCLCFHGPILKLLFPNAPEGKLILQISSFTIIFAILDQTINGALQGIGKVMTPAISLAVGVIIKCILNIILVPIPRIGAAGAAFATAICHVVAFIIGYRVLLKNVELSLKFSNFIIKPILATFIMAICSYSIFYILERIITYKLATIISILIAIMVYILTITILKIFTKEEIQMLPYGEKMYKILEKIKIY